MSVKRAEKDYINRGYIPSDFEDEGDMYSSFLLECYRSSVLGYF